MGHLVSTTIPALRLLGQKHPWAKHTGMSVVGTLRQSNFIYKHGERQDLAQRQWLDDFSYRLFKRFSCYTSKGYYIEYSIFEYM